MSRAHRFRLAHVLLGAGLLGSVFLFGDVGEANAADDPAPRPARVERGQHATPAERRAMRAEMRSEVRRRWEDASPQERRQAGRRLRALERALPDFSPIERLTLLRASAELPAEERKALRKRIRVIDDLAPTERAALLAELRARIRAHASEIDRFERNRNRWKGMSEAERKEARRQMKRLREMSVEERRVLLREMEAAKER